MEPLAIGRTGLSDGELPGMDHRRSLARRALRLGPALGVVTFLTALSESRLDVTARFVGDFRPADREWAEQLQLGRREREQKSNCVVVSRIAVEQDRRRHQRRSIASTMGASEDA